MYTALRARRRGARRFTLSGHVYDISASGVRFELDRALEVGSGVELRITLPGLARDAVQVSGRVVRLHDEEGDCGPVRMGLVFDSFATQQSRRTLERFLDRGQRIAA
jgi:c-di-GMP-binding flagellar brake protein YcgR